MSLNLIEFQKAATETATYRGRGSFLGLIYCGLGLCGEAGEVAEKLKKIFREDEGEVSPEKKVEIEKELGDVLWYVAMICDELGIRLDDVGRGNIVKLRSRMKRGVLYGSGDNR
jgi:NTP pyrophosphatase (non-canonical NTP hydrolase)